MKIILYLDSDRNDRLRAVIDKVNEATRNQPGRRCGPNEVGVLGLDMLFERDDADILRLIALNRANGVLGLSEPSAKEIVDVAQSKALRQKTRKRDGSKAG